VWIYFVKVKRQIIKAFLIGICITVFGGAAFIIDELFFPFTTILSATGVDYCLIVIFSWVFWLHDVVGDKGNIILIVLTVFFWGGVTFLLMEAKKISKHLRETSNR
jgi:hypothetical protein